MSWMQKLYQTYNEVEKNARLSDSDKEKLAPLWHSPQTAHIQIELDDKGNFQGAKVLEEKLKTFLSPLEKKSFNERNCRYSAKRYQDPWNGFCYGCGTISENLCRKCALWHVGRLLEQ